MRRVEPCEQIVVRAAGLDIFKRPELLLCPQRSAHVGFTQPSPLLTLHTVEIHTPTLVCV